MADLGPAEPVPAATTGAAAGPAPEPLPAGPAPEPLPAGPAPEPLPAGPAPEPAAASAGAVDGEDLAILDRAEAELTAVDAALRRLDGGTYGCCEVCGRPVGDEVLAASPTAARCRACG